MAGRALITGIAGQDGSYLAELLLARGDEVAGLDRPAAFASPNLDGVRGRFTEVAGDLLDPPSLHDAVARTRPTEIYHLAAPTFVPDSWEDPTQTLAAIAGATATVLAAALAADPRPRVWVSTSSEVFGDAPSSPQDEGTPMRPRSPYGVAKLAAHGLICTMRAHHGLFACSGITYNHESPRRPPHFLPRKVTRGAAAISLGMESELVLGDLDAVRDWSDARDIMRGAVLALERARARRLRAGERALAGRSASWSRRRCRRPASRAGPSAGCASIPRSCARASTSRSSATPTTRARSSTGSRRSRSSG